MKSLSKYINEAYKEKNTTGDGCIEMIRTIIDQLSAHPNYKGKDKDLWYSAGQFVFDYLSELTDDDRAYIMDAFGLPKFSNWKKTEVHDVMLGLHTILQQITNPS